MPISVVCNGCKTRFAVSEKFAGQTGPCPKCKKPITIPKPAAQSVTIHEPESPAAAASPGGHGSTVPFRRVDRPVSTLTLVLLGAVAVGLLVAAFVVGRAYPEGTIPPWLLLSAAFAVAIPCVVLGYAAVRDREREPWRGMPLLVRTLCCAAVYAGLWAVKGMMPADATAEMWQWIYLAPVFGLPGALAALVALELDWGQAITHFSFYVLVTALLRYLAGLPPL